MFIEQLQPECVGRAPRQLRFSFWGRSEGELASLQTPHLSGQSEAGLPNATLRGLVVRLMADPEPLGLPYLASNDFLQQTRIKPPTPVHWQGDEVPEIPFSRRNGKAERQPADFGWSGRRPAVGGGLTISTQKEKIVAVGQTANNLRFRYTGQACREVRWWRRIDVDLARQTSCDRRQRPATPPAVERPPGPVKLVPVSLVDVSSPPHGPGRNQPLLGRRAVYSRGEGLTEVKG
jgi:hypothetical protein